MTLPTFLGIGVPRAGTTWLHELLSGHPEIFLPTRRKEVRFFDRHHQHGLGWYEGFFCPPEDAARYRAIGEISPQYLYGPSCPGRIALALPDVKLIVLLRHPVDRAFSNYGFVVQRRNFRGTFEEFLRARPLHLERGFYSRYLERYVNAFGRERILVLLFEEAVAEGGDARRQLASFLGVSADGFPASLGRVNTSGVPRFGSAASLAVKLGRRLRRIGLDPMVDLGGRLGLRRAISGGSPMPRLDPDVRRELSRSYEHEFEQLETALGIDVGVWRDG